MEEDAQALDCPHWDSDETVIEGSVTESDLEEEEELPWRRLLFDQHTPLRSESNLYPGINGMHKGILSPEIQCGFKLREDPHRQMNKNEMMQALSRDEILQKPQDEGEQNEALQTRKSCSRSLATVSFPQAELSQNRQSLQGPEMENPHILTNSAKELSEDRSSPEISLLSGIVITVPDVVSSKEKLLSESVRTTAEPNKTSKSGKEIPLAMSVRETKDEESSLETFVSAIERLPPSPEILQEERLFGIMGDIEPAELLSPLSGSLSSLSVSMTSYKDLLENRDDSSPDELVAALNALSEANVSEPVCHRTEGDSSLVIGDECLGVDPHMSYTDDDYTQMEEIVFESLCSAPLFEQESKVAEPQDKQLPVQQTEEDPHPLGLHTLQQQSVISCDPLNSNGDSNLMVNSSEQDTRVLRRSTRVKGDKHVKYKGDMCTESEKILPNMPVYEKTNSKSSTEKFRIQDPTLLTEDKEKNMHSSREQIRKNKKSAGESVQMKTDKIPLSCINRRNIFGETLLYKAAVHDDVALIKLCIKNGGNVNQQSYAGWTALHEACVGGFYQAASELLEGGADVNIKGMHQITPLHDAVRNGHYKVAQLLLINGADPLLRSENGMCALDEVKDSCMRRLLERYVPKHQKHLIPAHRNSSDLLDVENQHEHKKPKFSPQNCIELTCDKQSNRQKTDHAKIGKESKEALPIDDEIIYECHKEDSKSIKLLKSKHKQATLSQKCSARLRKDTLQKVNNLNTTESKDKRRENTLHKWTQVDVTAQENNLRKTTADSSSKRISRLITHQEDLLQCLDDLPEQSCKSSSPPLSSLKSGVGSNPETCLTPQKIHSQNLDISDSQKVKFLELEFTGQTEVVSFPELSLHKEIELLHTITNQQLHTHQELEQVKPYTSPENRNIGKKSPSLTKLKNSFLSFIKDVNNDNVDDSCTSEKTLASKRMCSTDSKTHNDCKETSINRDEEDSQQYLLSEDHFSQESQLNTDSITILPQQEAANFPHSDNIVVSGQQDTIFEQCIDESSFDHSHENSELTSLSCTKVLSTEEVSKSNRHMELLKSPDYGSTPSTPLMIQTDNQNVEVVNQPEEIQRNYFDKDLQTSSSNEPFSTVVHPQVIETTEVEKKRQDLPEGKIIHNIDFYSIDTVNKELTNISQLSQREEMNISHKPDKELISTVTGDKSTVRTCGEMKEKTDSEIHLSRCCIQEHKHIQIFGKNQSLFKAPCTQEMKTAGMNKRNAKGESRLHLAAKRGDLSLVKTLIESGADVNQKDNAGWTPLHEASSKGFSDIIIELLKSGANVNCENLDGILPLHDAAANSHLQAAEILLQHGAKPNQKNQKQKTALDEADDEAMKELLKSYGATETETGDGRNAQVAVKIPTARTKRKKQCFCDDCKTIDSSFLEHQGNIQENHPVHKTIGDILQDIEEKQDHLLKVEIRSPEDADQYIEKMLMIKEVMDNVLAKQKAERDDLAKKYRVSIESFKHGVLREQLANLATRQKNLLVVARKQKEISLKIQNYKNVTSVSGLSLKKLPPNSEITAEKDSQERATLEYPAQSKSHCLSPVNIVRGSMQEAQLSLEMWSDSQNTNPCLNAGIVKSKELSGNKANSKRNIENCTVDELSKSRQLGDTTEGKLLSQPVAYFAQVDYSDNTSNLIEITANGYEPYSSSVVTGTLNISETTSVLAQNNAHQSAFICDRAFSSDEPNRGRRKTTSQKRPRVASESLAHQQTAVLGRETGHQIKPYLKKSTFVVPHANDNQNPSSFGSDDQHTVRKPLNSSAVSKKKCMQIKDLILLGRIHPGSNVLEFKTQETTHKASILPSGNIKADSGQIYQNPVTWVKDLLGDNSSVTWNYAWSKVTYFGKELLKYTSEQVLVPPEPNLEASTPLEPNLEECIGLEPDVVPQQHQSCHPGTSRETMQSIPHYLQINEILLISDQEYLPRHIMDRHWKFYVECEELTF